MIDYNVRKIPSKIGRDYIIKHHYSHGCHNAPTCYGLFDKDELIGVCAFACPCSENVRSSVFGEDYKNSVTELHRLHILDVTPKNTESWFISRCFNMLKQDKPYIKAVISFADPMQGHVGTIYKATNAYFCGTSGKATFYEDENGKLHHPRNNGHNISITEAKEKGWKPVKCEGKYRYLFLLPKDKREKRFLKNICKII